eukprot:gnl/MRDRNA2_/MRDRNA2_118792_c0_seq1.p1 gnl/MRDRNA2_/MRDRNA2_118792_c0~~gnl/MRDRNA2_/MRDRNA2_118792_c0_seq1.p1  ORF type:complete len:555 (+),score=53.71 gnl/MRDRNA2_/MRDRNA2_118792_c0_seq1:63-1727(+)
MSDTTCKSVAEPVVVVEAGSQSAAKVTFDNGHGIGLDGCSGHSLSRQLRFAFGSYGPFIGMLVVFYAKDMYVLKFGANTKNVGIISTAWCLIFPFMYPLSGYLMDREPPLFEVQGWGRRAPWFCLHLPLVAVILGLMYLPGLVWLPNAGSLVLDLWLASCLFLASWCLAVLVAAWESARAEIYPFKEERSLVEAMTKFVGVFAAVTGILPQLILWVVFTFHARLIVSCVLFACVMCTLEVVPILKDAKQPRDRELLTSLSEIHHVVRNPAMFHACCLRFWHSAADTTVMTFSIYYVTFVDGCDSIERAKYMVIAGAITVVMEICILTPLWGCIWGKRSSKLGGQAAPSMRSVCSTFHVLASFVPPMMLASLPAVGVPRPWEWSIYAILVRLFYSPQTFFRTNSYCWAVDEDCHQRQGRRREAVHAGVVKLFEDEGRVLAFVCFIGLGWAGLQMENCGLKCADVADHDQCVSLCEKADIARQPEEVRQYITACLMYIAPSFGLLCAFHTWRFPLHGKRLQLLQENQAFAFKDVKQGERVVFGHATHSRVCEETSM